jgi:hypothetical protein
MFNLKANERYKHIVLTNAPVFKWESEETVIAKYN